MPTFQNSTTNGQVLLIASVGDEIGQPYPALLDTGAQSTMVSPKVVNEVGLEAIGYADIVPVSGKPLRARQYRTSLHIPIGQGSAVLLAR